jgi:hypothetical protein
VPTNIDQIQSLLPCLPEDGTTTRILFKRCLEYKSPYMSGNIRSNITMMPLKDLIKTPLCKECNIFIHPQWNSLFALHMQSNSNVHVDMGIEDNSNADKFEEEIENPPSATIIHNFLDS